MKEYYSINEKDIYNNVYSIEKTIEEFTVFKGPTGSKGERGYEGVRGLQGLQGQRGYKGDLGKTGDRGQDGYQGYEGVKGIQGMKGPDGDKGFTGFMGFRGEKGLYGDMGPDGYRGEDGEEGLKGRIGYLGEQGDKGDMGVDKTTGVSSDGDIITNGGWEMTGFVNDSGAKSVRSQAAFPFYDPYFEGLNYKPLITNHRPLLETQCPYNGYLSGFTWYSHLIRGGQLTSKNGENSESDITETDRVSNPRHSEKMMEIGLPHAFRIDCKNIKNEIPNK